MPFAAIRLQLWGVPADSSHDAVRSPDPATDPVAYNEICQQTPTAPDCGLPLYWPAPPQSLKTSAGMHRFTWDMHYDPIAGGGGGAMSHGVSGRPDADLDAGLGAGCGGSHGCVHLRAVRSHHRAELVLERGGLGTP